MDPRGGFNHFLSYNRKYVFVGNKVSTENPIRCFLGESIVGRHTIIILNFRSEN